MRILDLLPTPQTESLLIRIAMTEGSERLGKKVSKNLSIRMRSRKNRKAKRVQVEEGLLKGSQLILRRSWLRLKLLLQRTAQIANY